MNNITLCIVTALACEAKPVINYYGLKIYSDSVGFKIYSNGTIALIISGMGRIAAAAATAFLQVSAGNRRNLVWLNIGTAGHRDQAVGEPLMAHKIIDYQNQQCSYPQLVIEPPCATGEIITVDQIERDYPQSGAYEMEAMGFFSTACRFSTAELVHALKIISDNLEQPATNLNKQQISELIAANLATIDKLVTRLQALLKTLPDSFEQQYQAILQRCHFTVTQAAILKQSLQRYLLVNPEESLAVVEFNNARTVLQWLERCLAEHAGKIVK